MLGYGGKPLEKLTTTKAILFNVPLMVLLLVLAVGVHHCASHACSRTACLQAVSSIPAACRPQGWSMIGLPLLSGFHSSRRCTNSYLSRHLLRTSCDG